MSENKYFGVQAAVKVIFLRIEEVAFFLANKLNIEIPRKQKVLSSICQTSKWFILNVHR